MNDAQTRGKCVWWLSGQCHGGRECGCIPRPRPADTESEQDTDGPARPSRGRADRPR